MQYQKSQVRDPYVTASIQGTDSDRLQVQFNYITYFTGEKTAGFCISVSKENGFELFLQTHDMSFRTFERTRLSSKYIAINAVVILCHCALSLTPRPRQHCKVWRIAYSTGLRCPCLKYHEYWQLFIQGLPSPVTL